jgi:hypothetical protein
VRAETLDSDQARNSFLKGLKMLPALEVKQLHLGVVSATATSSALDLSDYEGPVEIVVVSNAAGSGITNAMKITDCDTSGGSYTDVTGGGLTSVTNAVFGIQKIRLNSDAIKKFIKLAFTVSGGSGTGIIAATVIGNKKYK